MSDCTIRPSNNTILWDINTFFGKCRVQIAKLLQDHPSHLHFATDAWISPNHLAFLYGQFILSMKVPCYVFSWIYLSFQKYNLHHSNPLIISSSFFFQSHTGVTMAMAFQKMLKLFGLTEKIYVVVISRKFLIKYYEYSFDYLIIIVNQIRLTCYLVYSTLCFLYRTQTYGTY